MKIKTWLIFSYLFVIFLPIAAGYGLFYMINHYDEKQGFLDFLTISNKISEVDPVLQNPELYQLNPATNYKEIDKLADETMKITLYRADGVRVYSSTNNQWLTTGITRLDYEELYRDLYKDTISYYSYSVKKPVLKQGQIVGIYEVTVAREQWLKGVQNRTVFVVSIFVLFIFILLSTVLYFLHRRLNRPLNGLMKQMTAFANKQPIPDVQYNRKDEIGELFQHFTKMREQIDQAGKLVEKEQREKEYMIASLSHDLKTPLTSIRAYNESLFFDYHLLSSKERGEYAKIIFEKIDYMKQMIDDLTTYTLLQSSQYKVELVQVDGEEFFEMLADGYEEYVERNKGTFCYTIDVCGEYKVNAKQMIRLIDNLMGNAMQHLKENGQIGLCFVSEKYPLPDWVFPSFYDELNEWRQGGVLILVQNEGEGVPKEKIDMMFKPFVQLDEARTKQHARSSGLGLSIAKMIIDKHHGKIKMFSNNEEGTIVACWIENQVECDD